MTMNELCNEYMDYSRDNYKRNTNLSRFSLINNYIVPGLGDMELNNISYKEIDAFFIGISMSGLKQNTLFGIYACLLSIFKYALCKKYLSVSPMNYSQRVDYE